MDVSRDWRERERGGGGGVRKDTYTNRCYDRSVSLEPSSFHNKEAKSNWYLSTALLASSVASVCFFLSISPSLLVSPHLLIYRWENRRGRRGRWGRRDLQTDAYNQKCPITNIECTRLDFNPALPWIIFRVAWTSSHSSFYINRRFSCVCFLIVLCSELWTSFLLVIWRLVFVCPRVVLRDW